VRGVLHAGEEGLLGVGEGQACCEMRIGWGRGGRGVVY
jgi:hypothetical protein